MTDNWYNDVFERLDRHYEVEFTDETDDNDEDADPAEREF